MTQPLFETAHQALSFAYNFSASTLDRPLMSRMADKYAPSGKGLAKQDGAGQAGMILRRLEQLPRLQRQLLIARFAPRTKTCVCCGGEGPHHLWMSAVREIAFVAQGRQVLPQYAKRDLCVQLVARYFGQQVHLQRLARDMDVAPNTVTTYKRAVIDWLHGTRFNSKGAPRKGGVVGQEQIAMDAAEAVLLDAGIIGEK